ncbi:MAG: C40 family peptidase [Muribaculaceae bacterium]|nr:C40 family peptidase [Muribaculaceae bacterium]
MNLKHKLLIPLFLVATSIAPAIGQTQRDIHKQMHSELLANAKNSIDKSALQNYIQQEIETKEAAETFANLSAESAALIPDLIKEAKSHFGKKYVWASKGPNTFDCSGFTSYVYKQFGIKITSSSRGQYTLGQSVNKNNLRPGDLVFFTSPRSGSGVGHVGMVVTADNNNQTFTFIHASVKKGITISESTESYYAKRYVGARRIITE